MTKNRKGHILPIYSPPIVAVLDVRLPRKIVIREVLPALRCGFKKRQIASLKFLNRKLALSGEKRNLYCDALGDNDLIHEVALRQQRYWMGKICIFFTADQGFHRTARRALKKNQSILLSILPLCGRSSFSRRQVAECLKECMVRVIRKVYFISVKKEGRTAAYFKSHPEMLGRPPRISNGRD